MKTMFTTILLVSLPFFVIAQHHDYQYILQTDSTWGHEFFEFPIRFAQTIPYTGLEDATFPRGWSDQENEEFWSYVFAWDIAFDQPFNAKIIERDLQTYFDGLMKLNDENKGNSEVKQSASKFYSSGKDGDTLRFQGKVRTLNAFHTQKAFTLNVTVEQLVCPNEKRSIVVFRFSPKDFDEPIWDKLNAVVLNDPICGNKKE